jgi:hypothetical protein
MRCTGKAFAYNTNVFASVTVDDILLIVNFSWLKLNIEVEVFWDIF